MRYLMAILMGGGFLLAAGCGNLGKATEALEDIQTSIADLDERVSDLEDRVSNIEDQMEALTETEETETTKTTTKTGGKTGGETSGGGKKPAPKGKDVK